MASARNVDVRIIVPAHSDHWYMKLASAHYYETQIAGSVRIFERQGVFSHAKAMLVDGQWAYLGSSNCDSRSFRLNFELDLLIGDGDFPGILYQQFLREFEQCKEITPETVKYTPGRKLLQSLCALACPVL
jgi:cardiolipin synthase